MRAVHLGPAQERELVGVLDSGPRVRERGDPLDHNARTLPTSPARETVRVRTASGLRLRRADVLVLVLFVACALFLFRLSLFEGWTFVGDSDRLNTALNVRVFETDAIRARGSVPTWIDDQFMGYGVLGLHWMLPVFTPVPYLLALLPRSETFYALAALSAALLALTFAVAYWALGAYTTGPVPRVVGALLYALGSYTVHKLTQLDLSFAALTAAPLLALLVREARRETSARTFLGIAACWAGLVLFTVLQEIAYIALFFGTYALYRSVRLRDPWPVLIAGLAFGCGVLIGLPRVVTVGIDFAQVARPNVNIATESVEALRFFGDGLLGRSESDQVLLQVPVNTHEGVQLLTSSAAALATIFIALLARSRVMRLWGVGLVLVLSVAATTHATEFYESFGILSGVSLQLRTVLVNLVLIGLPLWLGARWLAARVGPARDGIGARRTLDEPPAATVDAPFFIGFVTLALAAILIPEARAVVYYAFLRVDFHHSRISDAMTFPLAALAATFVSRFWPSRLTPAALRWLAAGLALGLLLWLAREAAATLAIDAFGERMRLRPSRLLTLEVIRVATSLLVVLGVVAMLAVRRLPTSTLTLAGGALAGWIALEAVSSADHRLNGPQTRDQSVPFQHLNYLNTAPDAFRLPTPAERAAVQERLEVDRYRVVLQQDVEQYPAHVEPHLAQFWGLRLVEGYSMGLPRRLGMLPWGEDMTDPHDLDLTSDHNPPWRLLAALNVKYVVAVDRSFWYNPAPGGQDLPVDPGRLEILENPHPVTPRAFFAARVSPTGSEPRFPGDDGVRPVTDDDPYVGDPARHSVAEGLAVERRFATGGVPLATFDGDRIAVQVDALSEDRFLVLNEAYHPAWQALVDGQPTPIYPTNLVMRGIIVPAGATSVELRFVPFLVSWAGLALFASGVALTGLAWWGLRRGWANALVDRWLTPWLPEPRRGEWSRAGWDGRRYSQPATVSPLQSARYSQPATVSPLQSAGQETAEQPRHQRVLEGGTEDP